MYSIWPTCLNVVVSGYSDCCAQIKRGAADDLWDVTGSGLHVVRSLSVSSCDPDAAELGVSFVHVGDNRGVCEWGGSSEAAPEKSNGKRGNLGFTARASGPDCIVGHRQPTRKQACHCN